MLFVVLLSIVVIVVRVLNMEIDSAVCCAFVHCGYCS